mmetsp:Transcript_60827/g.125341  ORF Transcript_60827/g.125341 Transcript_60827/m.125341 type:complete len:209 (-) Transcript_60827:975-1601(-)
MIDQPRERPFPAGIYHQAIHERTEVAALIILCRSQAPAEFLLSQHFPHVFLHQVPFLGILHQANPPTLLHRLERLSGHERSPLQPAIAAYSILALDFPGSVHEASLRTVATARLSPGIHVPHPTSDLRRRNALRDQLEAGQLFLGSRPERRCFQNHRARRATTLTAFPGPCLPSCTHPRVTMERETPEQSQRTQRAPTGLCNTLRSPV